MAIRLQVTTTDEEFRARINFATAQLVNNAFKKSKGRILDKTRELVKQTLSADPTINSLIGGSLQGDFGLTDDLALSATDDIINIVSGDFGIKFDLPKSKRSKTLGTMVLYIDTPQTIAKVMSISGGRYQSNIYNIPWIEWLLSKGAQVVVGGWEYVELFDEQINSSRSGQGIMMKTGGSFRVEPEHAGTLDDNFITRAIGRINEDIQQIVVSELQRAF